MAKVAVWHKVMLFRQSLHFDQSLWLAGCAESRLSALGGHLCPGAGVCPSESLVLEAWTGSASPKTYSDSNYIKDFRMGEGIIFYFIFMKDSKPMEVLFMPLTSQNITT